MKNNKKNGKEAINERKMSKMKWNKELEQILELKRKKNAREVSLEDSNEYSNYQKKSSEKERMNETRISFLFLL